MTSNSFALVRNPLHRWAGPTRTVRSTARHQPSRPRMYYARRSSRAAREEEATVVSHLLMAGNSTFDSRSTAARAV